MELKSLKIKMDTFKNSEKTIFYNTFLSKLNILCDN